MLKLYLKAANFKQYIGALAAPDEQMNVVEQRFAQIVSDHVNETMKPFVDLSVYSHYLCSTIIDVPFSSKKFDWSRLQKKVAEQSSFAPGSFVNAYECASWGYSLRHALRRQTESRYVLISIIDLNVLELEYWKENSNWGKSGFGITTLLFECSLEPENAPEKEATLNIGVARGNNAIAEFTLAMRNHVNTKPTAKLAYPYFPENVTELFYKLIPSANFLPDYHGEFGHCFGADPWISIIKDYQNSQDKEQSYLAASVALNGYWGIADVSVNKESMVSLSKVVL